MKSSDTVRIDRHALRPRSMSTSLTKLVPPAPPSPAYRLLTPRTPTVPLLATPAARICSHAHAPLVLCVLCAPVPLPRRRPISFYDPRRTSDCNCPISILRHPPEHGALVAA